LARSAAPDGVEIGAIADRVSEVPGLAAKDVDETPSFGVDLNADFILGIGKSSANIKILLDIDKVPSAQETTDLHAMAALCPRMARDGEDAWETRAPEGLSLSHGPFQHAINSAYWRVDRSRSSLCSL
jgi:hypothetical protein